MGHIRGAPYHPQTQGKIERWHQTLRTSISMDVEDFAKPVPSRSLTTKQALWSSWINQGGGKRRCAGISPLSIAPV
jgi:transposase InsO family protein